MAETRSAADGDPLIAEAEWIDSVADRFEAAWKNDREPPALSAFVAEVSGDRRARLLRELAKVDFEWRCRRGRPRPVEDYCGEFPELCGPDGGPDSDLVEYANRVLAQSPSALTVSEQPPGDRGRPRDVPAFIDKYRVIERIDEGAQGVVFRAIHPALSKDVAIKLSLARVDDEPVLCERVLAEGRLLARLEHPDLVRVYDCGLYEGHVFVVMDYVRGQSLDQYARAHPVGPRSAAALVARVARCLAAVHRQGTVHQDLKPGNVVVQPDGVPRLMDFGLARQRHLWVDDADEPGGGTPAYAAPEQARGEWHRVGTRSDVFGLGGLLYFLLTGRAPFAAATRGEALERARRCDLDAGPLRDRRVPGALRAICLRALAADPAARYAGADDMAAELERFARWSPRRRWAALAGLVLALAGVALAVWWPRPRAVVPRAGEPPARQEVVRVVERKVPGAGPGPAGSLLAALPLGRGDRVRVECRIPKRAEPAAYWLGSTGTLSELPDFRIDPGDDDDRLVWPKEGSVTIRGAKGTEFVCVVANRQGRPVPGLDEMRELLDPPGEGARARGGWEPLPDTTLLWLSRDGVSAQSLDTSRDPSEPERTALTDVEWRLERFRRALRERCDYFWGVAIPHR